MTMSSPSRSPSTACWSSPTGCSWRSFRPPSVSGRTFRSRNCGTRSGTWSPAISPSRACSMPSASRIPRSPRWPTRSSRSDRMLEGRWWRRDVGGKMVRFVVCRKGDRHVIAARDGDLLVLQRVAPAGRAGRHGDRGARGGRTGRGGADDRGVGPPRRVDAHRISWRSSVSRRPRRGSTPRRPPNPSSWVEITATERHSGGTFTQADVAAGVLDSQLGRIVSIPRKVNGELFGSFLPGTQDNLQRALDELMTFLPVGGLVRGQDRHRLLLRRRLRAWMGNPPYDDDDTDAGDARVSTAVSTTDAAGLDAFEDYPSKPAADRRHR